MKARRRDGARHFCSDMGENLVAMMPALRHAGQFGRAASHAQATSPPDGRRDEGALPGDLQSRPQLAEQWGVWLSCSPRALESFPTE